MTARASSVTPTWSSWTVGAPPDRGERRHPWDPACSLLSPRWGCRAGRWGAAPVGTQFAPYRDISTATWCGLMTPIVSHTSAPWALTCTNAHPTSSMQPATPRLPLHRPLEGPVSILLRVGPLGPGLGAQPRVGREAEGGHGGDGVGPVSGEGGVGALVQARVPVTAGTTFEVMVGGYGGGSGGAADAGGGGSSFATETAPSPTPRPACAPATVR
jgi:hypothetical protein